MKKTLFITVLFLFGIVPVFATHQRAAEIVYKHINGLTYEIRIITYANDNPANDSRDFLPVNWGDGDIEEIPRVIKQSIGDNVIYNEYHATHTYPGAGTYTLSMEDPNRNWGVLNIPNSVNVPIYVETELVINPLIGGNNSVQLLNQPIDYGCINRKFIHNAGAYDPDGDSLSYKLIKCRGADGQVIPGYLFPDEVLPEAGNSFTINKVNGDVIWDVPVLQGEFNIAILIEEWRNGIRIGSVVRDMQIKIDACDENPPVFDSIPDTCIRAGDTLAFEARATSIDGDLVTITASGGPFEMSSNPAYLDPNPGIGDTVASTRFIWETNCSHVRKSSYQVYFKAEDDGFPVSLVDYLTMNITVVAPAPENLTASPLGTSINLSWEQSLCEQASGYKIYRRSGPYGFIPGACETGVPAYTGYKLIDQVDGIDNNSYSDDNNGAGLVHGITYCYMVTATFRDQAESYASNEACTALKRDLPVITNVSNDSAGNLDGSVYLSWAKPIELDTVEYPGPYQYRIMRAEGLAGNNFTQIGTNFGLNDSIYFDRNVNLNDVSFPYRYRIDLFSESIQYIGESAPASSIYLKIFETDEENRLSWDVIVPWTNGFFTIYRKDPEGSVFDSIGLTYSGEYRDTGLENGEEYCYYVRSHGSYGTPGIFDSLVNFSQKACGIPVDNRPPCAPMLEVSTDCEMISNTLLWHPFPSDTCDCDINRYLVYYSPPEDSTLGLIATMNDYRDTIFVHDEISVVIGCYAVKAVDSLSNTSDYSNVVCVDTLCGGFRLPNAFTPNGDQWNDSFTAFPASLASVQNINLVILNRWGNKVYETTDKFFKWDGVNSFTNQECPDGVYFYVCDVYEYGYESLSKRTINGSVTIFR
ncbi:MAG: gliding motility-associated C-terminal domain-containing protein [Bacteroidales bacterium]|nr:gliding motility-associated C-terminal domain-containing protein [Bacteroidales bacterium]MCF8350805.1 gliding motility-associated C-terminal domain-containing protein [Bacteroidales bacterium]MCF8399806.1 gliding motility-associated C-terminal domain-containing protein [Bacteroidales bacterium]